MCAQLADGVLKVLSDDNAKQVRQQAIQLQQKLDAIINDADSQTNESSRPNTRSKGWRHGSSAVAEASISGTRAATLSNSSRISQNPRPPSPPVRVSLATRILR